jgi:hypothetical protein
VTGAILQAVGFAVVGAQLLKRPGAPVEAAVPAQRAATLAG